MKLKEGSRYLFDVEKIVALGSNNFFVLKGPDQKKYLLDSKEYSDYNIECGSQIDCRLDKINCKGEFFLEPLHPYYKEGENYSFSLKRYELRVDKEGKDINVAVLCNPRSDEIVVEERYFSGELPKPGTEVIVTISKIIKGQLIVGSGSLEIKSSKNLVSRIYSFVLVDESTGVDNKQYYIISDDRGKKYTLRKDYYNHYGFKKGESFQGRFIRYKDGGEVNIEPLNPWFKPGCSYQFKVKSIVDLSDGNDSLILMDAWGMEHNVPYNEKLKVGASVDYRVEKMRKGWPLLVEI